MIDKDEARFIDKSRMGRFATSSRKGRPHVVPVSHVWDKETESIWFVTDYGTKKLKNLMENNKVSIVFDEYGKRSMGVMVEGEATYIERGLEYGRIRALLYDKFPQYFRADLTFEEGEAPIVRIKPLKVVSWGLGQRK